MPSLVNYSVDNIVMKNGRTFVIFNAEYNTFFNVLAEKYLKSIKVKSSTKYNWDVVSGVFSEYRDF